MNKLLAPNERSKIQILVNGIPINEDWNSFATVGDAFREISKGNIAGLSVLNDRVQVIQTSTSVYEVVYE